MTGRGAALAAVVAVAIGGCGGGERQDKNEPSGRFPVDVVNAKFPTSQRLADQQELRIAIRNAGRKQIPNLAVTVDAGKSDGTAAFAAKSQQQGLADTSRPVWVVDDGPRGGTTAYTNTWALGPLDAGKTRTFIWKVTAVQPGKHVVHFRVAAGLNGKARAVTQGGDPPEGSFTVDISSKPAQSKVNPDTGAIER